MNILLLGSGLLGQALLAKVGKKHQVTVASRSECDVTKKSELEALMKRRQPELVINATGYTDVDGAETHAELAFAVNAEAVKTLVQVLRESNTPLLHFSTDYVFDGTKKEGYKESDHTAPLSLYGQSKAAGEAYIQAYPKHYLIRTAWLFGPGGRNFVDAILARAERGEEVRVVHDQVGSPTYTHDLAEALAAHLEHMEYGTYHLTNSGVASWFELAQEIFRALGVPMKVTPITTQELSRPAKRPAHAILLNTKLPPLRDWKIGLESYLADKELIL